MSKLRHVLKLYCNGTTVLQISTITGVSRNTVKKYIAVLRNLRTTWEEIARLSDKDLTELFCKEPDDAPDARLVILHEFFKQHDKRLRQRGMTLLRLWEQYIRDNEHGYHVSAFYRHHRLWTRRAKPSMHMEHTAGDKLFVDYTGVRLQIVDTETGVITPVEVFVAILGASQLTYVEATASQRAVDFHHVLRACVAVLRRRSAGHCPGQSEIGRDKE